ncbi:MAG: hypothetical protein DMD41_01375 [Gemmatimonadetes bacterium]|nr:MAG: hypothetical protein DMD41_01375 [Gemmatimonadota bacterium]
MSLHSRLAPAAVTVLTLMSCTIRVIQPPASPGPAQAGPGGAGGGAGPGAVRPDTGRPEVPWKPWKDVTKDTRIVSGLFTAYLKRENVYLALKPEQFDRDYLMVTELSEGIGTFLDAGTDLRSDLIRFHRAGDHVQLWVVNPYATATPNTPAARIVAYSFGHSVAQSFPIASIRDTTNEVLIDLAPFVVSDFADLGPFFQFISEFFHVRAGTSFDRERSSFQSLRMFPTNTEIEARLTFRTSGYLGIETLADYRYIPLGVHYSILQLPDVPMRPRYADDRVGYFIAAMKNYSRDTAETFFVRYVNRWRLEKKDPNAAVSEPVKPIVFYLDRTIPLDWRPYVRDGILEWNKAFEEAGFKNAIQVLDAPDDTLWSAEDARYSTVRWMADNDATYAIGPSDVDPRTGEILNADILFTASWIQAWQGEYHEWTGPQAMISEVFREDSLLRADPAGGGVRFRRLCSYSEGLAQRATLVRAALVAQGVIAPGAPVPREYIGQALKEVVMHEVGHTLGLRHNFRGSSAIPNGKLFDRQFTATHGTSASVMDYNDPVVALDRSKQGDYYSRTIGTYDRWAIKYGYASVGGETPDAERPGLQAIAGQAADPDHVYATDEDASFGGYGLDPNVTRFDQTTDPLAWAEERVKLVNRLFDSLEIRLVAPGEGYPKLRNAFTSLLFNRWYATLVTTKYLSGAYTSRDHRGDPNSRPAFRAVPAVRQREALAFIAEAGLGENAYKFPPDLLNKLAPARWYHWDANPFTGSRIDFPLHDWALALQSTLINLLTDPGVLARLRDAALRAIDDEQVVTIPDVLSTLTATIWAEAGYGPGARRARNAGSIRRDLQRQYLNSLVGMVVGSGRAVPEDARTVARATLGDLAARLDQALAGGGSLDAYTRAHYADSRERIRQALNAQMVQTVR